MIEKCLGQKRRESDRDEHTRHHEYIGVVIAREARREERREALRRAVIEKTLTGLIWAALVVTGTALWQYIKGAIK
jgi:hypothetical protein